MVMRKECEMLKAAKKGNIEQLYHRVVSKIL